MTQRQQPPCPECEKLASVSEESNKIGDFINWIRNEGMEICDLSENEDEWCTYEPVYLGDSGINRLLARYYEIDLNKVEKERRALLEWLREVQGG